MSLSKRYSKKIRKQRVSNEVDKFQDWMRYTLKVCLSTCNGDELAAAALFDVIMESLKVPGFEGGLEFNEKEDVQDVSA
jgi:hypothetical protein